MNKVAKNLIFTGVLSIMLLVSQTASAYYIYTNYGNNYNSPQSFTGNSVSTTNNTNNSYQPEEKDPAPAKKIVRTSVADQKKEAVKKKEVEEKKDTEIEKNNSLTALTISGNDVFMPDTIFEWILIFFFILIIIILARQLRHRKDDHKKENIESPKH
ncbi:MAG: hypothetical protein U9R00_01735 [Patescibacteria group bacterium]|nr:hypothetical protein [Patescibacteria group bacterium]